MSGTGNEVAVGYISLIPVAKGMQGAIASQLSGASKVASAEGKRSGSLFAQAFNAFGVKKMAAALTVGGIVAFGKKSADAFKNIAGESLALQRVMGGSVQSASEWRGAMQLGGLSAQQFQVSARKLSQEILKTGAKGTGPLHDLGVNVKDAAGHMRSMDSLLPEIAEKFKTMPNGAQKTALAVQLFGRSGLQMLPFLNRGAAGLEDLKNKAKSAGIVIGDKGVKAFKDNLAASRLMKAQWQGLQVTVGQALLPVMTLFTGTLSKYLVPALRDATTFIQANIHWLGPLAAGLLGAYGGFKLVAWSIGFAHKAIAGFAQGIIFLNKVMLFLAANPVVAIIAGIAALAIAVIYCWNHFKGFRDFVMGVVNWFKGAGQWLQNAGAAMLRGLWIGLKWFWDNVLYWYYIGIPKKVIGFFVNAAQWLINAGSNILRGLLGGAKWFWDNVLYWYYIGIPKKIVGFFGNAIDWLYRKGQDVVQGFWDGLTYVWRKVTGWIGSLAKWIKDHKGPVSFDRKLLEPAGRALMEGLYKGLRSGFGPIGKFIKDAAASIGAGFVGGEYSMGTLTGGNKNALYDYAKAQMAVFGWNPSSEFAALYSLWQGESGWNPLAKNPSSGAYGIPQSLPADKMASAGPNWLSDAATQIRWGLRYIRDAYGSPSNAYAQWLARRPHWYKEGAWSVPQDQLAYLHKKEMVVPTDQAERFRRGAGGGQVFNFYGSASTSDKKNVQAAAREMAWAYRTLT